MNEGDQTSDAPASETEQSNQTQEETKNPLEFDESDFIDEPDPNETEKIHSCQNAQKLIGIIDQLITELREQSHDVHESKIEIEIEIKEIKIFINDRRNQHQRKTEGSHGKL